MELQDIQNKIYEVRKHKVMLDFDLAVMYEVETKRLNEAVKRNSERFPLSFMFRLTVAEWEKMRSQFATASGQNKRNTKTTPFAFTEHGVTMLAGVLKSEKAIKVNIAIVEAFVALKKFAFEHKDLTEKLKKIESKYNKQFKDIYEALNYLLKKDKIETDQKQRVRIGFRTDGESSAKP